MERSERCEPSQVELCQEPSEVELYQEVHEYLTTSRYPEGITKVQKATIRKRSKNFDVDGGILYFKQKKGDGVLLQVCGNY